MSHPSISAAGRGQAVGIMTQGIGLSVNLPFVYGPSLPQLLASRSKFLSVCGLLCKVLARYGGEIAQLGLLGTGQEPGGAGNFIGTPQFAAGLAAAVQLTQDYLREGLIGRRKTFRGPRLADGTPDWPRTLRLCPAQFEDDTPFYPNPILRRRKRDWDHDIVRLHVSVLAEISNVFLLNLDLPDGVKLDQSEYLLIQNHVKPYLAELRSRLFADREIHVLRLIEQFFGLRTLASSGGLSDASPLVGVHDFEFVWERMLRVVFQNQAGYDFSRLPAGTWVATDSEPTTGVAPRTDFARAHPNVKDAPAFEYFCLFDAKYLSETSDTDRWSGQADIYKQMLYWTLLSLPPTKRTMNACVFPCHPLDLSGPGRATRLRGVHYWTALPQSSVFEIAANFERVALAYLGERSIDAEGEISSLLAFTANLGATPAKAIA